MGGWGPVDVDSAGMSAAPHTGAECVAKGVETLQDVLGLGSEARMNYPSRAEGNWTWRATAEQFTPHLAEQLAELSALYGR